MSQLGAIGPMTAEAAQKEVSNRIKEQMSNLPIDVLKKIIDTKTSQDQGASANSNNEILAFLASGGNQPGNQNPNPNGGMPPTPPGTVTKDNTITSDASLAPTVEQPKTIITGSTTDKARNGNLLEGLASGLMMAGAAGQGQDPSAILKNLLGAKIQQQEIAGTVPWQKGEMEKALATAGFDTTKLTQEGINTIAKAHDEVFKTLTPAEKIGMTFGQIPERLKTLNKSLQGASGIIGKSMESRAKVASGVQKSLGNIKVTSVKEIKK
jgi:hypothetical protein